MTRVLRPLTFAGLFLALDALWLSQAGPHLYAPMLGGLLAREPRFVPAAAFYAIYLYAAYRFAPAESGANPLRAAGRGALFGFAAYATYDLTNEATLAVWPLPLTLIDLTWGSGLTAVASAAAVFLTSPRISKAAQELRG